MRWFTLTVLASLALIIAVNGIATLDRARQDARLGLAASSLRPGLAMVFNGFVDERRLQKARLEVIERARAIVFGSSRVREISGALVHAAAGNFYNLGMSAAVVEDYIGLWSLIEERGIRPDIPVFGVDAWVFNANHEQSLWHALAPEVSRFLGSSTGRPWTRWPVLQGVLSGWDQSKELLSYTVLQTSVRDLERTVVRRKRRGDDLLKALAGDLVPEPAPDGQRAIRADGSVILPPSDATPAQIRDAVLGHVRTGPYGLVDFQWNREAAVSLERLWQDMRARGVELVVYTPPYHPAAWEMLRREPRYQAALDSTALFLARLTAQVGARFLDASDPAVIPCGEVEFYDMQHATAPCLERLWQRLASLAHYDVVVQRYEGGDLAVRMLFSPWPFPDRDVILRPRPEVPAVSSTLLGTRGQMLTNPEGTGRLLLEGDSFAPPLADFLARHFESVLVPETGRLDGEVVARDRPDVVLLEVAERNVNRLAREPRQLARACDK